MITEQGFWRHIEREQPQEMIQTLKQRRRVDQEAWSQGRVSFEGLRSNFGIFDESPGVSLQLSPEVFKRRMLEGVDEVDRILMRGLGTELNKQNLNPDRKTFYLLSAGLPHLPALEVTLLDKGIDPSVLIDPSKEHIEESPAHFERYFATYKGVHETIFDQRLALASKEEPNGYAVLLNGHARIDEKEKTIERLPKIDQLKKMGIERLVLSHETFYARSAPIVKDGMFGGSVPLSAVNKYCTELSAQGINVHVLGFDYRYHPDNRRSGFSK